MGPTAMIFDLVWLNENGMIMFSFSLFPQYLLGFDIYNKGKMWLHKKEFQGSY